MTCCHKVYNGTYFECREGNVNSLIFWRKLKIYSKYKFN